MSLPTENWFYARGGQQTGPVTLEQLQNLLLNGHIDRDSDLVWAQGLDDWSPASKINGLVPTAQAAPVFDAPGYIPDPNQAGPPVPYVKRASFPLLMILGGAGFLCFLIGAAIIGVSVFRSIGGSGSPDFTALAIVALLVMFVGVGFLIAAMVFFFIYLYRAWLVIQPFRVSVTPGLAVGLCFVPFFNLYWRFRAYYNWAVDYNRVVDSQPAFQTAPRPSVGLFLSFCVLSIVSFVFGSIGFVYSVVSDSEPGVLGLINNLFSVVALILSLVMAAQICSAVNFFAGFHQQPERQ